jgi:hypothetical protein
MNNRFFYRLNRAAYVPLLLVLISQSLMSCVSTKTAGVVQTQVMDPGLERKVLRETGLSGALLGVVTGAAIGIGAALLVGAITGQQPNTGQMVAAGVMGATAGGIFGWHKGKEKGGKVLATAKDRDHLKQLALGARQYNAHIDNYNTNLRRDIASAKSSKDQTRLLALSKAASAKLSQVDKTITVRQTSINNLPPSYRDGYKSTLAPLQREEKELRQLEAAVRNMAGTEKSIKL